MTTPLQQALAHCASEKIQHSGHIQPYAALVVFTADLNVTHASNNCPAFFDCADQSLLGQPLSTLIGNDNAMLFQDNKIQHLLGGYSTFYGVDFPLWINSRTRKFKVNMRVFKQHPHFVAEFSPNEWSVNRNDAAQQALPAPLNLGQQQHTDLNDYLQYVADDMRRFSGYDRVMIYRFEWNWDGQVVAESVIDGKQPFLGLHFPASDIPEQARQLYSQNTFNMLVDTEAETVAISTLSAEPLDLTHVICRGFSPVHIQYLRNMGVRASLSIPILLDGHFWGLIACHHYRAKHLSMPTRKACSLVSQTISHKITQLANAAERQQFPVFNELLLTLSQCYTKPVLTESVIASLLGFMQASSAIIYVDGRLYCIGEAVSEADQATLLALVQAQANAESFACPSIAALQPDLAALSPAICGVFASPVNPAIPYCVMWLRPERVTTRQWGGQHQADDVLFDDSQGYIMRPRKSFEAWQGQQRLHCQPWDSHQTRNAQQLAAALLNTLANTGY